MKQYQYKCPMKMHQHEDIFCDPECAWCVRLKDNYGDSVPACAVSIIAAGAIYGKDMIVTDLTKEDDVNDSL